MLESNINEMDLAARGNRPIAVAMSGGVDSSVVAGMLQRAGDPVIGMTMQLWNQRRLPEMQPEAERRADAARSMMCTMRGTWRSMLGIPYYVVNFEERFEEQVVKPFVDEYLAGRTPIPCTLCNNFIKFDQFLEMAEGMGARDDRHRPLCAASLGTRRAAAGRCAAAWIAPKDQTYFLCGLTQAQLARTLFPLGGMEKSAGPRTGARTGHSRSPTSPTARRFASFRTAITRGSSTPIFGSRASRRRDARARLSRADGRVVGEHAGVHHFTVGQRRGLRVAAARAAVRDRDGPGQPSASSVGRNEELLRASMTVRDVNWISIAAPRGPVRAK